MNNIMPLYQSMLNDLIQKIESGQLPEDSKLPSEQKLGELYNVSRITVRRALAELESRNYIYKKQGQGSFVSTSDESNTKVPFLDVNKMIEKMGALPKVELQKFELNINGTEKRVRKELGLSDDDYLYVIQFMYYADEYPVFLEKIYLPFKEFPMIHKSEIENNDKFIPFIAKKYQQYPEFISQTEAGLINKNNRKIFNLNVGDPLVNLTKKGVFHGRYVYYSQSTVVGDLIMFIVK
ncbi:GntR family transcriptional regulator [Companilactobacillus crustorum]|uniref:GntR family transcriptional regulator n=1 Tax=Companilactobacillus crustorum TaxID=392416 RepID=UPI00096A4B39|nr:GntR family transcriptional regulator [Companilactobacillus crustorum]WDT65563.1 GntR family transcriptional regulator [Companilactobacillus crustorum]